VASWGRLVHVNYVARLAAARTGHAIGVALALTDTTTGGQRVATWKGDALDPGLDAAIASLRREPGGGGRKSIWLLGAGGVVAAGGVALWIAAFETQREFNGHLDADGNVTGLTWQAANDLQKRARTFGFAGDAVFAVGAIAASAGLVWTLTGPRKGVVVEPIPGGASLKVSF
jgi:hypothetical protein